MKAFLDDDFLLTTKTASVLYHEMARDLPAQTVPATLRNPLYHWTHMELSRPFGIRGLLLDTHYADSLGGGYFKTADDHEKLLAREKPARDGAIPSGNSIAALNLLRLYEFTGNPQYAEDAGMIFSAFQRTLDQHPETQDIPIDGSAADLAPRAVRTCALDDVRWELLRGCGLVAHARPRRFRPWTPWVSLSLPPRKSSGEGDPAPSRYCSETRPSCPPPRQRPRW